MTDKEEKKSAQIRHALDEIVGKLEQDSEEGAMAWADTVSANRDEWARLKQEIRAKQKALKELVTLKRAGDISSAEFESRYRALQDELTSLEFRVYNLRLGTSVDV
ncbi:MAG: hypothetical protein HXY34_06125 [Candidatus Thorarchaeota archaeon]|nr:hypothetical protein [Candidatus Thorarchaeota archaeon]